MRYYSFIVLLLLLFMGSICPDVAISQTVLIRDIKSLRPVDNVAIYNQGHTRTALSNIYGIADITSFIETDTLIFQHTAYQTISYSYAEVAGNEFNVYIEKKSIRLDEIVISATRFEQDIREIPNRIIAIPAEKIKLENPQTSADLLANTNEVFVQKSQLGGGSPMIRGFSANKVLIVVDGVRMNNAIFREGNLQNVISIDPNSLSQAEVIFGPGTVIYGSDALGGVMSFNTLEPVLSLDKKLTSKVNFMARYSSANTERTGHIDISLAGKKWASVTSFSSSWFDDLRMGANGPDEYLRKHYVETRGTEDFMVNNSDQMIQRFSGYNQMNVMQKFRLKPNDWMDITYGFHYSESSDVPRYDRLLQYDNNDTLKYASWYYGPQKWMMNVLNSSFMVNCRMITELKVTLAWQRFEESRHSRKFSNPWFKNQNEMVDMYTANIDIEKKLNTRNSFFYGFEGVYNNVTSTAFNRNFVSGEEEKTGTRYPDGRNDYSTYAAYVNFKHRFNEETNLLAGVRYNYVNLKSTFDDTTLYHFPFDNISIQTGALNGSVGINWQPADVWLLRLNVSSGFRAPNLDDVGKVFDSSPGNVVVPNPDLKPEFAYSVDAGIQRQIDELMILEVSAFYTYLKDAMVRRDFTFNGQDSIWYDGNLSQVEAIVNESNANIYGVSATVLINMGEYFKLKSAINWVRGEGDDGYALRHVSPVFGNTTLTFRNERFTAELYANYNGAIPYSRLAPSERDKPYMYAIDDNGNPYSPSWWTLNLKSTIRIIEQMSVDIGIENILNQRYRPYSSGIASPGRNFILTLRASL